MSERRDTSAPGQALEFEIWSELIKQSRGALHVFLPLLGRGLDGVLHRLTDGRYVPVQIKGKGEMVEGMVEIVVRANSLVDDEGLIIGSYLGHVEDQLDLVVEERIFKALAAHEFTREGEVYAAAWSMHPNQSHWRPYLVPRANLADRILGRSVGEALERLEPELLRPSERHNSWLGFLGESEVIRRLAENPRLDLFRPFPDLEMVEVLVRQNVSARFAGLQVKSATLEPSLGIAHIGVRKATLSHATNTWLVGLGLHSQASQFDGECFLIPSGDIPKVAIEDGALWAIHFHPSGHEQTRLDPYRKRLSDLPRLVESVIGAEVR